MDATPIQDADGAVTVPGALRALEAARGGAVAKAWCQCAVDKAGKRRGEAEKEACLEMRL